MTRRIVCGSLLASLLGASPAPAVPVSDILGDAVTGAYRTYDITAIDATFTATDLTFTVTLSSAPLAPSGSFLPGIRGFIDIDVDGIAGTGATSNITAMAAMFPGFGSSGLGMEFYLDLFTEAGNPGFVDVRNPFTASTVGFAPITYGTSSFSVRVPLGLLGPDDGFVNYAVVVGDFGGPADQARDAGLILAGGLPAMSSRAAATPAPEPATLLLFALGCCLAAAGAGKRRTQQ